MTHELPSEAAVRRILRLLPPSSFVAQFVRWFNETSEAPLIFGLFGALQAIEACAGGAGVRVFHEDRALNQFTAFVGASGHTHKSWSMDRVKQMVIEAKIAGDNPGIQKSELRRLAADAILGKPNVVLDGAKASGSDQDEADAKATRKAAKALKKALKKAGKSGAAIGTVVRPPPIPPVRGKADEGDEPPQDYNPFGFMHAPATHQAAKWVLSQIEGDPLRKSLITYPEGDEFFVLLDAEKAFRSFFMKAYDGRGLSDMTKGAQYRVIVEYARVSLLLGATPEHIQDYMTAQSWMQGFAGRFLWAYGISERRKTTWDHDPRTDARWDSARDALRRIYLTKYDESDDPDLPKDAQRAISEWSESIAAKVSKREDVILSRRRQHAEKITKLLAINNRSKMTKPIAAVACLVAEQAVWSALALHQMCPNSKRDKEYQAVLRVLTDLAAVEVDPDGKLLAGRKTPVFTQAEVYAAVGAVERMQWDYLEGLLTEMNYAGLLTFREAPDDAAEQYKQGLGAHKRDDSDLIHWRGPRPRVVVT